jgi:hypothetical protein
MRLGSVRRATLVFLLHERAGRRPLPQDITSRLNAEIKGWFRFCAQTCAQWPDSRSSGK